MNGWNVLELTADFRTDWLNRTVMADFGYAGPDLPGSHIAAFQFTDADDEQLDGSKRYTITFEIGSLPPVSQFWSLPTYDEQGYFFDDELVIYVQHEKPDSPGKVKSWLPALDGGMRFAARFYSSLLVTGLWILRCASSRACGGVTGGAVP